MELDRALLGQMLSQTSSYDFMDNPKYKKINKLLVVLNETFGYNEDLHGLIRSQITEGYKVLGRKQVDMRKMMQDELVDAEMDAMSDYGMGTTGFGMDPLGKTKGKKLREDSGILNTDDEQF